MYRMWSPSALALSPEGNSPAVIILRVDALCLAVVLLGSSVTAQTPSTMQVAAGAVCFAPTTGFCTACDACCMDLAPDACTQCVSMHCAARCIADGLDRPCNVCEECCDKPWLGLQHNCETCANTRCLPSVATTLRCGSYGTLSHPALCSGDCIQGCWMEPSSPCIASCTRDPDILLVMVLMSFGLRTLDYLLSSICKYAWRVCLCRGEGRMPRSPLGYNEAYFDDHDDSLWQPASQPQSELARGVSVYTGQELRPGTVRDSTVWVRDDNTVPWIRGVLEGPRAVRPVEGRLRAGDRTERVPNPCCCTHKLVYRDAYYWTVAECQHPREWAYIRTTPPGFTLRDLVRRGSSWDVAVENSTWFTIGIALFKLLFWHILQPVLYFWVFMDAYSVLEPMQKVLGYLVAVREGQYLLCVLMCTLVKPEFLLVDIVETVRDKAYGFFFLAVYVIAPEKFVTYAFLIDDAKESTTAFMHSGILCGMVLDLCAVMAFAAALGAGNVPPALLVGYMVTSLGMLLVIVTLLVTCCAAYCATCCDGASTRSARVASTANPESGP